MNRAIRVVLGILGCSVLASAAAAAPVCRAELVGVNERCPAWSGSYNHPEGRNGNGEDIGRAIAISPGGDRVYITGQSRDDATVQDLAVAAFDAATGSRLWSARWETPEFDTGSAIVATASTVFVTGRSGPNGNLDWVTAAFDAASGQTRWVRPWGGPAGLDDTTFAIGASPDGATVFVTGGVDDGIGAPGDIRTVAYEATTGEELWARRFDGGGYDGSFLLEVAGDGETVYVGGDSRKASTDAVALAYDARGQDAGSLRWAARVDNLGRIEEVGGLDVSQDGRHVAIAATSRSGSADGEFVTSLIDASNGTVLWTKVHNGTRAGDDEVGGVALADDVAVVTGKSAELPAAFDYATIAYDLQTGAVRWTKLQNSAAHFPDYALDIEASPDGDDVFVTGYGVAPKGEAGILVTAFKIEPGVTMTAAYDAASGNRSWVAMHNDSGVGADVGVDLEVSPNGQRVYIGGTFVLSGVYLYSFPDLKAYAYDFGVIAYDA